MPQYPANLLNALGFAWPPLTTGDPINYPAYNVFQAVAKYFGQQVINELWSLISSSVTDKSWGVQYTCGAGDVVGAPVRLSGSKTVTTANALTGTNSKIIGYIRHKGVIGSASVAGATTCYLQNFIYVSGLTGGVAGNQCFLTNFGLFSNVPGTVAVAPGIFISATEAILYSGPNGIGGSSGSINSGAALPTQALLADGIGGAAFTGPAAQTTIYGAASLYAFNNFR